VELSAIVITAAVDANGKLAVGDFSAQMKQVMDNLTNVLKSAGADWSRVVKTTYCRPIQVNPAAGHKKVPSRMGINDAACQIWTNLNWRKRLSRSCSSCAL